MKIKAYLLISGHHPLYNFDEIAEIGIYWYNGFLVNTINDMTWCRASGIDALSIWPVWSGQIFDILKGTESFKRERKGKN